MNTLSGQILASKYNSPLRGTRASWDITRLIPGLEQRKMSLEMLLCQKKMKYSKGDREKSKAHRSQLEGTPTWLYQECEHQDE